ncbi:MAG: hypothetical protein WC298_03460 [Sideroxydans sp.]|jgi:hypothetical protein
MRYRHYKGGICEIVCEAKLEADPNITLMTYKSDEAMIWAKSSSNRCSTKGRACRASLP